jgi:hypothetical protein
MPIVQTTPESAIEDYLNLRIQHLEEALLYRMQYVGERCLRTARGTNSYKDQTGNLRSSLGYVIVKDGAVVQQSGFRKVKKGSEGTSTGEKYAQELALSYPKGIALIVVAGMHYASYVSAKGYDVLDSAELLADKLVPKMLNKLGLK